MTFMPIFGSFDVIEVTWAKYSMLIGREKFCCAVIGRDLLETPLLLFTPLVFTTTGGTGKECLMYHSRLTHLIAIKKGEQYAKTISLIRTRTSFALLRTALVCLRGSRTRRVPRDINNVDIDVEVVEGAIQSDC